METDIYRLKLDLKAYKRFLNDTHEGLILENDRKSEKKAREL